MTLSYDMFRQVLNISKVCSATLLKPIMEMCRHILEPNTDFIDWYNQNPSTTKVSLSHWNLYIGKSWNSFPYLKFIVSDILSYNK